MTESDGTWLRTAELAKRWPIPESTWRYWRHLGYGPPSVKVGRHVLYRVNDVERWLAELQKRQTPVVRGPASASTRAEI